MQKVFFVVFFFFFLQYECARRIQFQLHAGLLPGHLSQLTLKETSLLSSLPRLLKKWCDNFCDVAIQSYKTPRCKPSIHLQSVINVCWHWQKDIEWIIPFFSPTQSHKEPFKMINEIFPAMLPAISDLPKESLKVNTRSASSRFTITFIKY